MRKSAATAIVARRLAVPEGRAASLVQRASEGGLLPTAQGSAVPDLSVADLVNVFLAIAADRGLGVTASSVQAFGSLTDGSGATLHSALSDLLSHGPALAGAVNGALIIRLDPASVSLTVAGVQRRFGPEPSPGSAGKHLAVPGQTLAAIGLELQGHSPDEADALVALARVSASASVGHAMHPRPA